MCAETFGSELVAKARALSPVLSVGTACWVLFLFFFFLAEVSGNSSNSSGSPPATSGFPEGPVKQSQLKVSLYQR